MHFRDVPGVPLATIVRQPTTGAVAALSKAATIPTVAQPLALVANPAPAPSYAPGSIAGAGLSVSPPATANRSLQMTIPVSLLASTASTAQIIAAVNQQQNQLQALQQQMDQMNYNRSGWWG